jgi:hypothetical protein
MTRFIIWYEVLMLKTLSLLILLPLTVSAAQITGIGLGDTRDEARTNALSDLSAQLLVQVRAEISISEDSSGAKEGARNVSAVTDVPLIGADLKYGEDRKQITATAIIDSAKAVPLYEKALADRAQTIRVGLKTVEGKSGQAAIETFEKLYADADTYEKLFAAAATLGSEYKKDTDFSSGAISAMLIDMQKTAGNLEDAVYILTRNIVQRNIYVLPPSAPQSSEVTPFAGAVQAILAGGLNSVENPVGADYRMAGEYAVQGKNILLTYRLINVYDGTIVTARTVRLAPTAFKGLDYLPRTADFDKLLKNGLAVSKDFRVDVSTDKGNMNLLFKNAQTVEILVKTTAPAYVYAIGHTLKKEERFSYLLEFQNADSPRRFMRFINADDANKWVSLGEFSVTRPFGVESIQVVASASDPAGIIPKSKMDRSTGLYIVDSDPVKALKATRALINTGLKKQHNSVAEAVLTFTTEE